MLALERETIQRVDPKRDYKRIHLSLLFHMELFSAWIWRDGN